MVISGLAMHFVGTKFIRDKVIPIATFQYVVAFAAGQMVVPVAASDQILPFPPPYCIITRSTEQGIPGVTAGIDIVVAVTTFD
jgi:hypothetical protein